MARYSEYGSAYPYSEFGGDIPATRFNPYSYSYPSYIQNVPVKAGDIARTASRPFFGRSCCLITFLSVVSLGILGAAIALGVVAVQNNNNTCPSFTCPTGYVLDSTGTACEVGPTSAESPVTCSTVYCPTTESSSQCPPVSCPTASPTESTDCPTESSTTCPICPTDLSSATVPDMFTAGISTADPSVSCPPCDSSSTQSSTECPSCPTASSTESADCPTSISCPICPTDMSSTTDETTTGAFSTESTDGPTTTSCPICPTEATTQSSAECPTCPSCPTAESTASVTDVTTTDAESTAAVTDVTTTEAPTEQTTTETQTTTEGIVDAPTGNFIQYPGGQPGPTYIPSGFAAFPGLAVMGGNSIALNITGDECADLCLNDNTCGAYEFTNTQVSATDIVGQCFTFDSSTKCGQPTSSLISYHMSDTNCTGGDWGNFTAAATNP